MKVLIAMLENMKGAIDEALFFIVKIVATELAQDDLPKNFKSMLIQVLAMCFWYNSPLTF